MLEMAVTLQRKWIEDELLKVPCRCPVCNRRTDLSRVPDVRKTLDETIAYTREDRERGLKVILEGYLPKLAFKEVRDGQVAFMVFCQHCTLADLHRLGSPDRIDYYKKKIKPKRFRFKA